MVRKGLILLAGVCLWAWILGSNAWSFEILTKTDHVQKTITTINLYKMADNAIFLIDASSSMNKVYKDTGRTRYELMLDKLKERNEFIPDLGFNFGMYLYTPWKEVYPMQPYDRRKFADALDQLPERPTGSTQIQVALRKLDPILRNLSGRTAVFVITDGTYSRQENELRPGLLADRLAQKYNVCFYVISTADDRFGREAIRIVSNANFCSRAIAFDQFIDRPEYNTGALYVVKADVDVVTFVETRVTDIRVDNVLFTFAEDRFDPVFEKDLDRLGMFMQNNPQTFAVLAGYTCNIGPEEYNVGLSQRRAEQVARYLTGNFGLDDNRLVTLWFGPANPTASNNSITGRKLNRRVEIAIGIE